MEDFVKPYEQNKINFVPNKFGFDKNMQDYKMHDNA
jgi:hypothetical protein